MILCASLFCGCNGNAVQSKAQADYSATTEQPTTTQTLQPTAEMPINEIIAQLIERNIVCYETYALAKDVRASSENADGYGEISDSHFASYDELSRFMYDTYTKELAYLTLTMPDCDTKPLFAGDDEKLLYNPQSYRACVYATNFSDYSLEITELTDERCTFVLLLPNDINNAVTLEAIYEENGWRLAQMFSFSPYHNDLSAAALREIDLSLTDKVSVNVGGFKTENDYEYNEKLYPLLEKYTDELEKTTLSGCAVIGDWVICTAKKYDSQSKESKQILIAMNDSLFMDLGETGGAYFCISDNVLYVYDEYFSGETYFLEYGKFSLDSGERLCRYAEEYTVNDYSKPTKVYSEHTEYSSFSEIDAALHEVTDTLYLPGWAF